MQKHHQIEGLFGSAKREVKIQGWDINSSDIEFLNLGKTSGKYEDSPLNFFKVLAGTSKISYDEFLGLILICTAYGARMLGKNHRVKIAIALTAAAVKESPKDLIASNLQNREANRG